MREIRMQDVQAPPVPEQVPDEVAAPAASEGLGELRASFGPKRLSGAAMTGLIVMCLVGLALFVLPGLIFIWRLTQVPNLNKKQGAKRIHCFEHGVVAGDRAGRPVAFRWDDAAVLQQITRRYVNGFHTVTTYLYTLYRPDGTSVELTGFYADPVVWGAAFQHEITRSQLPGVLDVVRRGGTVRFGDIAVNAGGVANARSGSLAWPEVERIEVKDGTVFVSKAGKLFGWSNTPVHRIPNFFVFLAVVDEMRGSAGAGTSPGH
ncbi:DUF6585 family protein [Kitasatospora sp. NPDC059795]|uniref:DUF6585 family protein n=1 Tax=Kitasatospora sp. NPDC059795 TaxID=3346949 RepID=UPI003664F02F